MLILWGLCIINTSVIFLDKHIPVKSMDQQDPGEEISLRRGRRSLTDDMGYCVPVEFENQNDLNTNAKFSQNGTLDQTPDQHSVSDSEGYIIPESDLQAPNVNRKQPFMISKAGKSYHFADVDDDGYAEPNADLPVYNVLEDGNTSVENKGSLTTEKDSHLEGTIKNAQEQKESDLSHDKGEIEKGKRGERGESKNTSFRDDTYSGNEHSGYDSEEGYQIPETDLSETRARGWTGQQSRQSQGEEKDNRYQNANDQSKGKNENDNATPVNPQYVNKKSRRRPPSPPRAPNNSSVHYV